MRFTKLALKIFAISLPLSLLVFYLIALSRLAYTVIYFPPLLWLGAVLVPDGGPAVLGAAMLVLALLISCVAVSFCYWVLSKRNAAKALLPTDQ